MTVCCARRRATWSGADDIVAVGDVAAWPNHRFDSTPRRIEHWLNAVEMGRAAAESLLAGPARASRFEPLPQFWSEQFGVRIQAAWIPSLGQYTDTLRYDGMSSVTGYLSGHRLVGVLGWDHPQALLGWAAELDRQVTSQPPMRPPAPAPRTSRYQNNIIVTADPNIPLVRPPAATIAGLPEIPRPSRRRCSAR